MNNFKTIVITGANGWLGQNLVNTLIEGDPVVGIEPVSADCRIRCLIHGGLSVGLEKVRDRLELVEGDLSRSADCHRLFEDISEPLIIHTAGIIHPKRVSDFYRVNVKGTMNLLKVARSKRPKKAIVLSSNSPYGVNSVLGEAFDEQAPYRPYMNYGKSKARMEREVREFESHETFPCVVICAPWFYGPYQPERQTTFFSMIRRGRCPVVGSGENLRSMAYTENLVQGILLAALRCNDKNKKYWVADERPYSMQNIIGTIADVLQTDLGLSVKSGQIQLPWVLSEFALVADKLIQGLGLYHQKIHVLSEMNKNIVCSIDKAKKELGYNPRVSLREGMKNSIQWCLDQGHLI